MPITTFDVTHVRAWKDVQRQNAPFRGEMKVQSACDLGQVTQLLGGVTGIQIQPNFLSFFKRKVLHPFHCASLPFS